VAPKWDPTAPARPVSVRAERVRNGAPDPVAWIDQLVPGGLRPFQRTFVRDLFRRSGGRRTYNAALLGLPRGSGKTELAAACALYLAFGEGRPESDVILSAPSREQAMHAFTSARRLLRRSEDLDARLKVQPGYRRIIDEATDSTIQLVSAEGRLQHGARPVAVVLDEMWALRDRELWEALVGGLAKREDSLLLCISTAGYDSESLLAEQCRRGESGEDPRFLYRWHGLAPGATDDYRSPATWRKANPALACRDPFLTAAGLEASLKKMREAEFRRWHLNQWTDSEDFWLSAEAWDACNGQPEIPEGSRGVVVAVDAAIRHDSTCAVLARRDQDGVVHAMFRFWEPAPGRDVDLGDVEDYVRETAKRYPRLRLVFDPYLFWRSAQILASEGIRGIEFPQTDSRMVPASEGLYEIVSAGQLRHGGHQVARRHALATAAKTTGRGVRIAKDDRRQANDAVVALAMAVDSLNRSPEQRSRYEEEGAAVLVV
jgi:phage terminase large subunit-like protein